MSTLLAPAEVAIVIVSLAASFLPFSIEIVYLAGFIVPSSFLAPTSSGTGSSGVSGLTLTSVPDNEQQIELFYRISLAPGGVVETIQRDLIPSYNHELFAKVLNLFDAEILGIDVIMEQGIEHDARKQKLIFLEVNSRPYLNMHNYPRYGEADDLSEHLGLISVAPDQQADTF